MPEVTPPKQAERSEAYLESLVGITTNLYASSPQILQRFYLVASKMGHSKSSLEEEYKNLDALLRNPLLPQDEGFEELACERLAWWDSDRIRTWFREKGYTLYERIPCDGFSYGMYPLDAERRDSTFPFAIHSGPNPVCTDATSSSTFFAHVNYRGNIAFAQDAQARHVAMKAILNESEEHRILKFLHAEGVPFSTENFNCIIPIIDLLHCEDHWIAIMPRWGINPLVPAPQTIREVFEVIHCLLTGLTYLHRHRISHGDIKPGNILVSHVDRDSGDIRSSHRLKLRSEGKLVYALYDFDGSHMFPASTSLEECRLPSQISFDTLYDQIPTDTLQGEIDFNPFAFDVGMLGVTFCQAFQHLTRKVPMLAPLFDRMVTRNIAQRLHASEALQFFEEEVLQSTPEHVLASYTGWSGPWTRYEDYDRWEGLDAEFVEKWAAFREPPLPRYVDILRHICEYRLGWTTINYIRHIVRFVRQCLSLH